MIRFGQLSAAMFWLPAIPFQFLTALLSSAFTELSRWTDAIER